MTEIVARALAHWDMRGAEFRLIAKRENQVFRVDHAGQSYAMRLHRPNYRSDCELSSELTWMRAVARAGISVPEPIVSASGDYLHHVGDYQVDVLTWLNGHPLGSAGNRLEIKNSNRLFYRLGAQLAQLHVECDEWDPPDNFVRPSWHRAGLLGEAPVWGRFWDNPTLSNDDRNLFLEARKAADAELGLLDKQLDFGLIHADLVRENVMVDGDKLQFIDFDDGGFGYRLFDIATVLLPNLDEQDYSSIQTEILDGYRSIRELDTDPLDLFMFLRSATYVGWIIDRMAEDGAAKRNHRFVTRARLLAERFLDNRSR